MVDELAAEFAEDPVVFLEYDVDAPPGDRISRWWWAWGSGGSVTLPMVMVDSGQQISSGFEDFRGVYRGMVREALERPPRARIEVATERLGDTIRFDIRLTNLSDLTLDIDVGAKIHAIVYEEARVADTGRWVRGADSEWIRDLAPGQSASYTLEVEVDPDDWDRVHTVVLADARPDGPLAAYDMLQAVHD